MNLSAITGYLETYGGIVIFIIVLLEYMNMPGFPAGVILPAAGICAANGGISFLGVVTISTVAGLLGSWILYFIGLYSGQVFLKLYLRKFPKHEITINRAMDLINRKGCIGLFISKMIPMIRTLISIPAGILKMSFIKYSITSVLGITIWNSVHIALGYFFGEPVIDFFVRGLAL